MRPALPSASRLLVFPYAILPYAILVVCLAVDAKLVAAPGEQITSFEADIVVNADATLAAREEFVVHSEGSYFKYGFVRQLPIDDEARWDERYAGKWVADNGIRVRILEVTENGESVAYKQAAGAGYPQLQIGPRNIPLAPGDHRYVIRYTVEGALTLGTGGGLDTLYWNAIGHYWTLPVGTARVRVHLPTRIRASDVISEPHVGGRGVSNNAHAPTPIAGTFDDGSAGVAYSAAGLQPTQSLSVVVEWPSGPVQKPSFVIWNRDKWYLAAPAALFFYYLLAWLLIGPEPKPGTVVIRYEPPPEISPAAARYLITTGTDGRSLAAVIASLASHECLRVEMSDGIYSLTRVTPDPQEEAKLALEESHALAFLFEDGPTAKIDPSPTQENNLRFNRYVANIQADLAKQLNGVFFTRHLGYVALGVLATFIVSFSLAASAQGRDTSGAFFMTTWLLFCGLILGTLIETGLLPAFKAAARGMGSWTKLMPATAATAVFLVFFGLLLVRLAQGMSSAYALMIAALALVNLIWAPYLKRTTSKGRSTLDALEGFRQFLQSVEQDRLHRLNAHAEASDAEIQYLPYAIALEVREAWGDHLADAFLATTIQR
jgi:hypothetical protein